MQIKFKNFRARPYKHRWGTIVNACSQLLSVEASLRPAWDPVKFNYGRPFNAQPAMAQHMDEDHGQRGKWTLDIQQLHDAISSDGFWAYLHMVDMLGS
eukprot:8516850-Lingulodinium_polyedra.AAC.1